MTRGEGIVIIVGHAHSGISWNTPKRGVFVPVINAIKPMGGPYDRRA